MTTTTWAEQERLFLMEFIGILVPLDQQDAFKSIVQHHKPLQDRLDEIAILLYQCRRQLPPKMKTRQNIAKWMAHTKTELTQRETEFYAQQPPAVIKQKRT